LEIGIKFYEKSKSDNYLRAKILFEKSIQISKFCEEFELEARSLGNMASIGSSLTILN